MLLVQQPGDYSHGLSGGGNLRLIFLGTPAFAVPSLEALVRSGQSVSLVVTQPDRPAGRGRSLAPPPVAARARELGLPVWQTPTLRAPGTLERLRTEQPDALALAAFGALVPDPILTLAPHGVLNVHPSLLPRWRGASPIQAALLAGDAQTGVSIIRLVRELDAGPILLQESVSIGEEDDYTTLEPRLAGLGAEMLVRTLALLERGAIQPVPQDDGEATVCGRVQREDACLDWRLPARQLRNRVRAYRGWPQAFTFVNGRLLKVTRASVADAPPPVEISAGTLRADAGGRPEVACGDAWLRLDEVVPEGRRPQSGADWLRGARGLAGTVLGGGQPPV